MQYQNFPIWLTHVSPLWHFPHQRSPTYEVCKVHNTIFTHSICFLCHMRKQMFLIITSAPNTYQNVAVSSYSLKRSFQTWVSIWMMKRLGLLCSPQWEKMLLYNWWLLLRVCAACPIPRLNLRFELCTSSNNIHDTFPTRTAQDTTELLGVRCEVKTRGTCT